MGPCCGRIQPLTSGVWKGNWSADEKLSPMEKIQLQNSDLISFHNYGQPRNSKSESSGYSAMAVRFFATEYMARGNKSTFQGSLPIAKKYHVAAYNWGLVAGKSADSFAVGFLAEALRRSRTRKSGFTKCSARMARHYKQEEADFHPPDRRP